jgi:hypothetical protein
VIEPTPIDILAATILQLEARIAALDARVHTLELAAARQSHAYAPPTYETQPRRIIDDRGSLLHIRPSAA